jgi:2-polyprenyl-6-methoxyphenol hydroxylase-like FAD-dependent oxidoreductase
MSKPDPQTQVLIIGGGIVGLTASLFLSSQNLTSTLVERHTSTSIHPRARGVNARVMELFRGLGIDDAIREAGASLAPSKGIYKGSSLVDVIGPQKRKEKEVEGKLPFTSYFEGWLGPVEGARGTQDYIEPVLLGAARERGGVVRFYTECVAFEQDENGVSATLRDRDAGVEEVVRAQYLIAADGAESQIRKKLGVGTTGAGSLGHLLNILFEADLREFVRGREFSLCYVEGKEVRGLFTSINNSDRWVFHLSYDPSKGEKVEDFPHERCRELIGLALGIPEVKIEIKSILPWEPTVRVAEKLQHGRIFLAGDAAHQMPPWGGQGATSGIADVHNLAWKLAAVIHGQATNTLLSTYDAERLPVGRLAAEESGSVADEHGLFTLDKSVSGILTLIARIPRIAGYGYTYSSQAIKTEDTTPLLWRQRWLWEPVPWLCCLDGGAGTRAPHLWVQHNGQRISTLDLSGKSFVLLAGAKGDAWCEAAQKVASVIGVELVAYRAGPAGNLVCQRGKWEWLAGISATGALLVRPDGFVAWRVYEQPPDFQENLKRVLMQALCR